MTATDPTSLLSQADAAIATRREMLAAGTPGEWIAAEQSHRRFVGIQSPHRVVGSTGRKKDARLIVAAVNAFAAATDHTESVLGRHRNWTPPDQDTSEDDQYCVECGVPAPCPDARDALTALGIVVE